MPDINDFGKPKDNIPRVMDAESQMIRPPNTSAPFPPVVPVPQSEKKDTDVGKEYITKSELQAELNNLARAIVAQITNSRNLTEGSVAIALREVVQRIIPREEVKKIAKDAIPATIRDIDSSASQRVGNVLMLAPVGTNTPTASGPTDSVYFGQISSGDVLPDGTEDLIHLIWDNSVKEWEAGKITLSMLIEAADAGDVLMWNGTSWVAVSPADLLPYMFPDAEEGQILYFDGNNWVIYWPDDLDVLPDGSAETPHLVWTDSWQPGKIAGLPDGGLTYQVLQRQGGEAVWDWVRWV